MIFVTCSVCRACHLPLASKFLSMDCQTLADFSRFLYDGPSVSYKTGFFWTSIITFSIFMFLSPLSFVATAWFQVGRTVCMGCKGTWDMSVRECTSTVSNSDDVMTSKTHWCKQHMSHEQHVTPITSGATLSLDENLMSWGSHCPPAVEALLPLGYRTSGVVGRRDSVVACATYKREIAGSISGCAEYAPTLYS